MQYADPEKTTTRSFKRLLYAIKKDIMQANDKEFSLLSKIHEVHVHSLSLKGDTHEKVPIESGFLLLQLSGHGDKFSESMHSFLNVKTLLPPSPSQRMDTSEMRLDHGAYINMLKIMESTALYAMYQKGITKKTLIKDRGVDYQTSDNLFQPNAFQHSLGTLGEWARWINLLGASDKVNELLNDAVTDMKSAKDPLKAMQMILDRSRNTVELDESEKLAMELSMQKNLSMSASKGLSFTPNF